MREVLLFAVLAGTLLGGASGASCAESSRLPTNGLRLVSNDDDPTASVSREPRPPKKEAEQPTAQKLPSLSDLGLNLDSSSIAKRNELDSFSVQPWAPGRGAVGVKVELTW